MVVWLVLIGEEGFMSFIERLVKLGSGKKA